MGATELSTPPTSLAAPRTHTPAMRQLSQGTFSSAQASVTSSQGVTSAQSQRDAHHDERSVSVLRGTRVMRTPSFKVCCFMKVTRGKVAVPIPQSKF
eukprot:6460324-Amphidinium_carterae.1